YRTPFEVIGDNGITIDAYSHNSINSKAIQELSVITTDHDERINFLEMENQYLKERIKKLESAA
ncbi:coiled-coil domain-containing family 149 protein, partial [Virgibacillus halodenitrificans]|uniref:coiled-coil domain-containing family 149 protein n=1 Tax=Virgibacillus halodenitrificans TaxID=1482 RepID=UPI001FB3B714